MHIFYQSEDHQLELGEEESRHCLKVMRLGVGDDIQVTNGRGTLHTCRIKQVGKRNGVTYEIIASKTVEKRPFSLTMAIGPTKKAERNEWMVEKMTEIGVDKIDFVLTENTIRETINRVVNLERLNRIAVAAMKQSQQFYLPEIAVHLNFNAYLVAQQADIKLVAYVPDNQLRAHVFEKVKANQDTILLIGPEGDFTPEEIEATLRCGFEMVSLGPTRLRTETAAVAGCHAVNLKQSL